MTKDTRSALIATARHLFAEYGYAGASVRAITSRAGANLGAITYYFGSKWALYEEVAESVTAPWRERLAAAAGSPGTAPERIEAILRAFFDYLNENPDLPRLIMQQLVSSRPFTRGALRTMRANISVLASVIAEGQKEGTIRAGEPRFIALSIAAQPIWIAMARRALQEGLALDQGDPEIRRGLAESIVRFVSAGLEARSEKVV